MQQYVREQKLEEERIKKEQRAEEERIKNQEYERWKERETMEREKDAREALKREQELELARIQEKLIDKELLKGTTTCEKVSEIRIKEERHKNIIDRLDKSFQNMKEDEDLIGFLTLFEAVATRCGIEKKNWCLLLSYKLTMKLKNFLLQDNLFMSEDYDVVKMTLMRQADINGESCRKKFHQTKPKENDFRGFVADLRRALENWMKMAEVGQTVEDIKEMIIKDRIMECVSSEVYRQLMLNKHDTVENILQVIEGFKTAGFNKSLSREENNVYVAAAVD